MSWDLWVDFHRQDADQLTHAHVADARPGIQLEAGTYVVVGNEDADAAVAHVVSIDESGVVLLRVFPGPVGAHISLLKSAR
jgi:hypothetical protein